MIETKAKNGTIKYKTVSKPERKKWSIKKFEEILTLRNDLDNLSTFKKLKKKDDVADTVTQLQAFKVQTFTK